MVQLHLSSTERDLLRQVLKNYLATLDVELCHTDHREFRALLKQRRIILARVAERLEGAEAAAAGG